MVAPLEFENRYLISSHTLLGVGFLTMLGLQLNHASEKRPLMQDVFHSVTVSAQDLFMYNIMYMYMCMCVYVRVRARARVRVLRRVRTYARTYVSIYTYIHPSIHPPIHLSIYLSIYLSHLHPTQPTPVLVCMLIICYIMTQLEFRKSLFATQRDSMSKIHRNMYIKFKLCQR